MRTCVLGFSGMDKDETWTCCRQLQAREGRGSPVRRSHAPRWWGEAAPPQDRARKNIYSGSWVIPKIIIQDSTPTTTMQRTARPIATTASRQTHPQALRLPRRAYATASKQPGPTVGSTRIPADKQTASPHGTSIIMVRNKKRKG